MKFDIDRFAGALGRLPLVRSVIRHPALRGRLSRLPGVRRLYGTGWDRVHPFDCAHGTDTSGFVSASELPPDSAASAQACFYAGSQPSILLSVLRTLPELHSCTFLDLGCGKGRALLVATELPFQSIIGVELSPTLAAVARDNVALIRKRFPSRTTAQVVEADAFGFAFPAGNVVLYLYHPFSVEMMAKLASNVAAALEAEARSIYVVYYNPVGAHCFDAIPSLTRRYGRTLPYAAEELGYGPDDRDAVAIWQGGTAPHVSVPSFTVNVSSGTRALIES